jgi:rare lipoprotein A
LRFRPKTFIMKRTILLLGFIASMGMLKAQGAAGTGSSTPKHSKSKKTKRAISGEKIHYGTASFYANKFEGRKTSTGEIFSQKKMTGASNILPLNHWVRVTNTRNNLSVILRINDRMHKNNKRLIDLSKSAARKLKYTGYGLARVKVELLGKKRPGELAQY